MAFSVQMPALGESVTEGTVTRWLKQEGDRVEIDEPLLEVSTDKVDTEIPSPAAGVVQRIVVHEDETVEVGAQLAVIGEESGNNATPQQAPPAAPAQPERVEEPQQPALTQLSQAAAVPPAPSAATGTTVAMPALGESVTEGTVTRWLKRVGDPVDADEPLLEVSTDKVDTEIPSPAAGTLLEILVSEDQTAEVGAPLAVIGSAEAAPSQPAPSVPSGPSQPTPPAPAPAVRQPEAAQQPTPPAPAQPAPPAAAPAPSSIQPLQPQPAVAPPTPEQADGEYAVGGHPYVTPLVRKLATQHGIDLNAITGTGVGGRIRKQDVEAAVEAAKAAAKAAEEAAKATPPAAVSTPSAPSVQPATPATPAPQVSALRGQTVKLSRLRQIVAQRTRESLQTSAQLTQVFEVDLTKIARLRSRAKAAFEAREGVKLTFLPFFAKATVEALKEHPKLNASINEEAREVTYYGAEHLGIAVDTERGLINAVIHNAGDLNLAGLAHKIADLAGRTRANKITPDELSGGTFSLTNLGSNGALFDTPIIVQPQVGILGVGVVKKRPVVVTDEESDGDTIAIRSMAYLALTYDHRLVDGADAGRFLTTIKHRLEEGAFEADLGL